MARVKTAAPQAEWEALLAKAMEQPGVADAIAIFEQAEQATLGFVARSYQHEATTASADEPVRKH